MSDMNLEVLRLYYRKLVRDMMASSIGPSDPTMIGEVGRYMLAASEQPALDCAAPDVQAWCAFTDRLTELGFTPVKLNSRKNLEVQFGTAPFEIKFLFSVRDGVVSDCNFTMYLPKKPYKPQSGQMDNPSERLVGRWRWGRKTLGEGVHLVEEIEPDMAKVIWGK